MSTPTVFFDIGATLITGPSLTPARQITAALGLNEEQRQRLDRHLLTASIDTPTALKALLKETYSLPEGTARDLARDVWRSQTDAPRAVPGGRELLTALQAAGIRYGFISNIWPPYAAAFRRLYGTLAETALQFFSFRLGLAKPDGRLFQQAADGAGLAPQACVMVGDSYEADMQPAMTLGFATVWLLHRPEAERVWLEKIQRGSLPAPWRVVPTLAALDVAAVTCFEKETPHETNTVGMSVHGGDPRPVAPGPA
ncbi:MAG: HAD family hydrolase [Rhodospirillaceae bacterium]|nr:MAG: HAD family hydrolase [Rhodospirillaceae bacterium]